MSHSSGKFLHSIQGSSLPTTQPQPNASIGLGHAEGHHAALIRLGWFKGLSSPRDETESSFKGCSTSLEYTPKVDGLLSLSKGSNGSHL